MITNDCKERPRWVTMTVPVIRHEIRVPKKISKLIYEMNLRGFTTSTIKWGDPLLIEFKSYSEFMDHIKKGRRTGKKEVNDFYEYVIREIDFKLNVHPFVAVSHEPVIISMILKHSQIKKFESLFYNAFIKNHHSEQKYVKKYENQNLNDRDSEEE